MVSTFGSLEGGMNVIYDMSATFDAALPNKPMHLAGALVLKEYVVFVRSQVSCNGPSPGRSLRSRLQVMGESVRPR